VCQVTPQVRGSALLVAETTIDPADPAAVRTVVAVLVMVSVKSASVAAQEVGQPIAVVERLPADSERYLLVSALVLARMSAVVIVVGIACRSSAQSSR
jgi:Zn-dependent membrane protease YugP